MMDSYWAYACSQHPCESTYEYFERYKCYLDENPDHGFQFHELITHFLDGMLSDECYKLRIMARRPLMDCTPRELWYLIKKRAESTRPDTVYNSEFKDMFLQLTQELNEHMRVLTKQVAVLIEDVRELKSAPKPTQFSVGDEEVRLSIEERADEDVMDEELQVVPITSVKDDFTEEWISSQCSDIIIDQNTVIACNPIILQISNILLSSNVQNDSIQKALWNNQVWGFLGNVILHIPMVKTPMIMLDSEKFLDGLCINWKTRKKDMRGSLEKMDIHMDRAPKQTQRPLNLPEGLHKTWKRRKKCKHIFLENECSMFSVYKQKSRSMFGWKPRWSSWRNVSHQVTKKHQRFWVVEDKSFHQRHHSNLRVKKFDGVHPWAPNIC